MKKRVLAILMSIMMIGISIPCIVMAEEDEHYEEEKEEKEEKEKSDKEPEDDGYNDEESYNDESGSGENDDTNPEETDDGVIIEDGDNSDVIDMDPVYENPAEELTEEVTGEDVPDIEEELLEEEYEEGGLLDPFALQSEVIAPSKADDSWQGYPLSYHYNWDNSQNCWNWGEYYNGVCYKTPEGTYDSNVRHAVGLYCDGSNIHLYIKYALIYGTKVNGDQFIFSVDGNSASFRFVFDDDGAPITGCNRNPGNYKLDLRNADGSISGKSTGFVGTLDVHENNENDELELIIPLEILKAQNPAINIDNFSAITFFNPNLMYKSQTCAGAGNGKLLFVLGSLAVFTGFIVWHKRKKSDIGG